MARAAGAPARLRLPALRARLRPGGQPAPAVAGPGAPGRRADGRPPAGRLRRWAGAAVRARPARSRPCLAARPHRARAGGVRERDRRGTLADALRERDVGHLHQPPLPHARGVRGRLRRLRPRRRRRHRRLRPPPRHQVPAPILADRAVARSADHGGVPMPRRSIGRPRTRRPAWLATPPSRPTICVTLGLSFSQAPHIFRTIVDALDGLDVHAIVTVGTDLDPALVGSLPRNVRVERYVPYSVLLPHCDAMVFHGGFNSLHAALWHGLPLVVIPQEGGDQEPTAQAGRRARAGAARAGAGPAGGRDPQRRRARPRRAFVRGQRTKPAGADAGPAAARCRDRAAGDARDGAAPR